MWVHPPHYTWAQHGTKNGAAPLSGLVRAVAYRPAPTGTPRPVGQSDVTPINIDQREVRTGFVEMAFTPSYELARQVDVYGDRAGP